MQPILQHLFQVSDLEDVSRERLESFVEEHPAFGIAHFLLSRKLQAEGSGRFEEATQRTCLYFSNPFWMQWLLENSNGTPHAALEAVNGTPVAAMPVPETPVVEAPVAETPIVEMPAEKAPVIGSPAEPALITEPLPEDRTTPEEPGTEEPFPAEPRSEGSGWENVVTVAEEALAETEPGDDLAEALSATEPETTDGSEPSAADRLLHSIEQARGLRETLHKLNDDLSVETALAGESLEKPATAAEQAPAEAAEEPIRDEEAPFVLEESTEQEKAASAERPAVSAPAADYTPVTTSPAREEPTHTPTQDILFEPYHTIDYFASQGIKLTLEENPADTLGKQLKSFTEWLKSMRRLPQKDREVVPDRIAEEAVQTIAAHSIEGREVDTEAMAEVLIKQGMREKARAVYEKLSLLNPDKRGYFAAKIEQLNIS